MNIRLAEAKDLKEIFNIEVLTFPPAEAASAKSFDYRFEHFPEYLFVAEEDGIIKAIVSGRPVNSQVMDDDMYENAPYPAGDTFAILSVATNPKFQKQGIASALIEHAKIASKNMGFKHMILACKENKRDFYKGFGFYELSISNSTHGGAVWYDMKLDL